MATDDEKLEGSSQTGDQHSRPTEDDEAYSPKSEELLNMPSFLARSLLYIVLAGMGVGVGWAYWGKKDVVIKAPGQLIRKGDAQIVQASINGVVRTVLVKEGEPVKKGQILAQLDTSREKINTQKQKEGYAALVKKKTCEEKSLDLLLMAERSFNKTATFQRNVLENLSVLCEERHAAPITTLQKAISAFQKAKIQSRDFFPKEQVVQKQSIEVKKKDLVIKKIKLQAAEEDILRAKEELGIFTRRYEQKTESNKKLFEAQGKYDEALAQIQHLGNAIQKAKRSILAKEQDKESARTNLDRLKVELGISQDNFATGKSDSLKLMETQKKYQEAKLKIVGLEGALRSHEGDLKNKQAALKRAELDLTRIEEEAKMYTQMLEEGLTDRLKFLEAQRKYDGGKDKVQSSKNQLDKLKSQKHHTREKLKEAQTDLERIQAELIYNEKAKVNKTTDKIKLLDTQRKYDEGTKGLTSLGNEISSLKASIQENETKIEKTRHNLTRWEFELKLAKGNMKEATPDKINLIERQRKYAEAVSKKNSLMSEVNLGESDIISQETKSVVGMQRNAVNWQDAQDAYAQSIISFKQSIVAARNKVTEISSGLKQMKADMKLLAIHKDFSVLKSPTDGVVSYVKPKGAGEVVRAGETLFSVILSNQPLVAKVKIANRSRGKVKIGLPIKVKMDSFPFQKYGVVKGTLDMISPSAKQDKRGSFYEGTISLENNFVTKGDQNYDLVTGMSLTAEIVVERVTMIESMLKPFRALKKG